MSKKGVGRRWWRLRVIQRHLQLLFFYFFSNGQSYLCVCQSGQMKLLFLGAEMPQESDLLLRAEIVKQLFADGWWFNAMEKDRWKCVCVLLCDEKHDHQMLSFNKDHFAFVFLLICCQRISPSAHASRCNWCRLKHLLHTQTLQKCDAAETLWLSHKHTHREVMTNSHMSACLCKYACVPVKTNTNTLLHFVGLLQLNSICRSMHTCKCQWAVNPCTHSTRARARQQRLRAHEPPYADSRHTRAHSAAAICCQSSLSFSITPSEKTDLRLSNTSTRVKPLSLFPWKPEGQDANERLCVCVTVLKYSPAPASTAAKHSNRVLMKKHRETQILTTKRFLKKKGMRTFFSFMEWGSQMSLHLVHT